MVFVHTWTWWYHLNNVSSNHYHSNGFRGVPLVHHLEVSKQGFCISWPYHSGKQTLYTVYFTIQKPQTANGFQMVASTCMKKVPKSMRVIFTLFEVNCSVLLVWLWTVIVKCEELKIKFIIIIILNLFLGMFCLPDSLFLKRKSIFILCPFLASPMHDCAYLAALFIVCIEYRFLVHFYSNSSRIR